MPSKATLEVQAKASGLDTVAKAFNAFRKEVIYVTKLNKELEKTNAKLSNAQEKLRNSASKNASAFSAIKSSVASATFATVAVIGAMKGVQASFMKSTEDIRKFVNIAYTMRASVGDIAKLGERFRMAGSNIDKMKVNIYSLQQALENKDKANVFKAIGIDDLQGFKTKGAVEQMEIILDLLSKIDTASARGSAARQIFGFRSQEMGQVIDQTRYAKNNLGEDVYEKILGEMKNLFDEYGTTTAQVAYNLDASWRQLERFFTAFFSVLSPLLLGVSNTMLKEGANLATVGKNFGLRVKDLMADFLPGFLNAIEVLGQIAKAFALSFMTLFDSFRTMFYALIGGIVQVFDGFLRKIGYKGLFDSEEKRTAEISYNNARDLYDESMERYLNAKENGASKEELDYKWSNVKENLEAFQNAEERYEKSKGLGNTFFLLSDLYNRKTKESFKSAYESIENIGNVKNWVFKEAKAGETTEMGSKAFEIPEKENNLKNPDYLNISSDKLSVGGYATDVESSAAMGQLTMTMQQQQLVATQKTAAIAEQIYTAITSYFRQSNSSSTGVYS